MYYDLLEDSNIINYDQWDSGLASLLPTTQSGVTCDYIINPRRMREGYGTCSVVRSFIHSFILSTALQRAAFTSSCQLRYEQAKHVDGLQCDSWILLKCFRSRVMAGSP